MVAVVVFLGQFCCPCGEICDGTESKGRPLTLVTLFESPSRRGGVECRDGGQSVGRWYNTTGASPDGGQEGHDGDGIRVSPFHFE